MQHLWTRLTDIQSNVFGTSAGGGCVPGKRPELGDSRPQPFIISLNFLTVRQFLCVQMVPSVLSK